jgi:eukaryotic-like serine/threonine-protein kinase
MGVVWRATDELLGRDVAVKEVRLNPALGDAERANAYKRTLREGRTAARLSHRGVVTIFDVVEEDGRPWWHSSCCRRSPTLTRPGYCTGT